MFPQRIWRSALRPDESPPDPSHRLEHDIFADFPPDLALDLMLNELVVRAADATHASAGAIALVRDDEMVCRAATGDLAPGLGIPIEPRDGLSGACLQTGQPQLCVDTESDPRVDPGISHRLGIRSVLAVPIFGTNNIFETSHFETNHSAKFAGVLEVFSTSPAAFSDSDRRLLEGFAEECARIRQSALEREDKVDAGDTAFILPKLVSRDFTSSDYADGSALRAQVSPYQTWAIVLVALTIVVTISFGLLISSRIGLLGPTRPAATGRIAQPVPVARPSVVAGAPRVQPSSAKSSSDRSSSDRSASDQSVSEKKARGKASESKQSDANSAAAAGDLVVYEKGKLVYRIKSAPAKPIQSAVTEAASTVRVAPSTGAQVQSVWLDPEQAAARLVDRTEPVYPIAALVAHQGGDVVLEVQVAEDGSVSHVRLLSGDPVLAAAAAEAVRTWRYQPYLQQNHASPFQTDVTLRFKLPN